MKKDKNLTDEENPNSDAKNKFDPSLFDESNTLPSLSDPIDLSPLFNEITEEINSLEEDVKNNPPTRSPTKKEKQEAKNLAEWCFNNNQDMEKKK